MSQTPWSLFEDSPNLLDYGQRTVDDRIAWGGVLGMTRDLEVATC